MAKSNSNEVDVSILCIQYKVSIKIIYSEMEWKREFFLVKEIAHQNRFCIKYKIDTGLCIYLRECI